MNWLLSTAMARLFKGLRTGNPGLAVLGAVALVYQWVKAHRRADRELLWATTLKPGQAVRIRSVGSNEEIEIEG